MLVWSFTGQSYNIVTVVENPYWHAGDQLAVYKLNYSFNGPVCETLMNVAKL